MAYVIAELCMDVLDRAYEEDRPAKAIYYKDDRPDQCRPTRGEHEGLRWTAPRRRRQARRRGR